MNIFSSANINQLWGRLIIEELIRNGASYFCVSPGSRSTPVACAIAEHPKARAVVHFDERGSAFHALGYASATGRPAVVVATSGSALANLFPAVVESAKKKIPMFIITADRPPELRFTGANQTIDQVKIFSSYVRFFFDMPCPDPCVRPEFVLTTVDQMVYQSQTVPPGPVHLNCMFREPLSPEPVGYKLAPLSRQVQKWAGEQAPYTTYLRADKSLAAGDIAALVERVDKIKSGVIVVGKLKSAKQQAAVLKLAERLKWPVFPDITSGLRSGSRHPNVIEHFDQLLHLTKFKRLLDLDGVLHLGGRMTSRRWYDFIEHEQPKEYIMVINHPLRNDPLHGVTLRVDSHVSQACEALAKKMRARADSAVLSKMKKASDAAAGVLTEDLKNSPLTETAAVRVITQLIPKDHGFFIASSLPIREADMYTSADAQLSGIGSNRGASGIDGTIATAVGYAQGLEKSVTLLTGDLSMLYDLNSLAMLKEARHPLVLVVLNNDGGGIFSFLPVAQTGARFEKFFGTPHGLTFDAAAAMFDLDYARPGSLEELASVYKAAAKSKRSAIIEIRTGRAENVADQERIKKLIDKKVSPVL